MGPKAARREETKVEDFESDLDTLRVRRAALEEQLKKAELTRGRSRINFATLTIRLQSSKKPLRTRMPREMLKH